MGIACACFALPGRANDLVYAPLGPQFGGNANAYTGATVIANYEISEWLKKQGVSKVNGQQHGGGHAYPFGYVKLTLAFHGSALPDGSSRSALQADARQSSGCIYHADGASAVAKIDPRAAGIILRATEIGANAISA